MEEKMLTCINCPLGCSVKVEMKNGTIKSITGNSCERGRIYAEKEVTSPTRIVTSIIPVLDGDVDMVSVKTASDIPKEKIFDCMNAINTIEAKAPISIGDVLINNVCGTNVDIIATKNINKIK